MNDKAEIDEGEDPNCPKGQSCGASSASPDLSPPRPTLDFPNGDQGGVPALGDILGSSVPAGAEPAFDIEELINNPAALRQILKQTGKISDDVLSAMDDETLRQVAREALGAVQTNTTTTGQ